MSTLNKVILIGRLGADPDTRFTQGGKVLAELALPVAGLMSLDPFETVRDRLVVLRDAAQGLGVTLEEPFLQLAFLALPVIPALKITDRGMVDVTKFEIIPG